MEISLLTPKCTLIPANFFNPASAREALAEVVGLDEGDKVSSVEVPQFGAVLVYCSDTEDVPVLMNENSISGEQSALPEMFYILRDLPLCKEYNKILCTWQAGYLFMGIAQGRTLLLANVYKSRDFTTAQYYIFLAMKSLQLNPEVSTISWRRSLGAEEEMSLYRYFKAVEIL